MLCACLYSLVLILLFIARSLSSWNLILQHLRYTLVILCRHSHIRKQFRVVTVCKRLSISLKLLWAAKCAKNGKLDSCDPNNAKHGDETVSRPRSLGRRSAYRGIVNISTILQQEGCQCGTSRSIVEGTVDASLTKLAFDTKALLVRLVQQMSKSDA